MRSLRNTSIFLSEKWQGHKDWFRGGQNLSSSSLIMNLRKEEIKRNIKKVMDDERF